MNLSSPKIYEITIFSGNFCPCSCDQHNSNLIQVFIDGLKLSQNLITINLSGVILC